MFQKVAVIVIGELEGGGDGEGGGVVWAKRRLARKTTERSRRRSLGDMVAE
jgi:hypothetical protein